MTSFSHTCSARIHAAKRLLVAAAVITLGVILSLLSWTFVLGVAGVMLLALGGYLLLAGLARLLFGGSWRIEADSEALRWSAPRGMGESFELPLAALTRLELRRSIRQGGEGALSYFLVAEDGTQRELSSDSGVDLAALAQALRGLGVEVVEVRQL
jgi:hypothetical protein